MKLVPVQRNRIPGTLLEPYDHTDANRKNRYVAAQMKKKTQQRITYCIMLLQGVRFEKPGRIKQRNEKVYSIGEQCSFGDRSSSFGEHCSFGDNCSFGKWCNFGEWCIFGKKCSFEGGDVKNGKYIAIDRIGRENRKAYFFIDESGRMYVRAGCCFLELDVFREHVRKIHACTIHEQTYLMACDLAEMMLKGAEK